MTCPIRGCAHFAASMPIDTMNNMFANSGLRPKYMIADVDTYRKGPEDDIYPGHPINYVKLDRVPGPTDDWTPILRSIRNGDFWVSTGEILIKDYEVEGTGNKRSISANLEYTYPLEFVEVVWGDGKKIKRRSSGRPTRPRTGRRNFRSRSTPQVRCGCGSPSGTRRAMALSRSPHG